MDPISQQANAQQSQTDPYYGGSYSSGGSKIKKIIIVFLIVVILGLLVTGGFMLYSRIGNPKEPENATLTYWGVWEDPAVMQPIIADFERTHPTIKVQYEKQDIKGLGQYVERLMTRINNGTGPDIVRFHSSWTPQLKNYLLPFPDDIVKKAELEEDYYKTVQKDLKLDGAYYGIPMGIDTLAMFVNTKLLQEKGLPIPTDWNDVYIKYAPELVVKDSTGKIITPGIALGTYDNISHAPDIVAFLLLQNRADLKDLSGPTLGSSVDALKFYTSFAQGEKATWDETLDNSTLAFAKGNLAIYFGYSWDIFTIKSLNPDLDFEVVEMPALAGRKSSVASYWAEGVSAKSKSSTAAFEFLSYLSKRETLQKLYETQAKVRLFGLLYPRKSMAPLLSSNKLVYPFVAQADNAQSTFFSSDTHDGENGMVSQMNVYLGNAVRSINNNTSVETAVETLSQGVKQVLSRY